MQQVIENWKINKGVLASKMQMPLGTFCNKLNPNHATKFSDAEIVRLKGVLIELSADIDGVTNIDFNEALRGITNG